MIILNKDSKVLLELGYDVIVEKKSEHDAMIVFDRQMLQIQAAFRQLETDYHETEVKYITIQNALTKKMKQMEIYNKIYQ